jgi:hypothetical protein
MANERSPEMPNPSQMQDRYGLPLTTSSTVAVERFIEGLDLLLEQNFGPEEQFTQAIEADPGFALAHSALAYMLHLRAQVPEARERAQQAQSLAPGLSRREQQQIEAIGLFVNGQGPRSYALIREHLADYPRDILMIRVAQRLLRREATIYGRRPISARPVAKPQQTAPCGRRRTRPRAEAIATTCDVGVPNHS